MPFLILSAGRDPVLLKSRNATLIAHGYQVAAATDSYEVIDKLLNGDFDLVLLCHTISGDDCCRLARIIQSHTPSTPLVLISKGGSQEPGLEPGAVRCHPDHMLATLHESLARHSGSWAA